MSSPKFALNQLLTSLEEQEKRLYQLQLYVAKIFHVTIGEVNFFKRDKSLHMRLQIYALDCVISAIMVLSSRNNVRVLICSYWYGSDSVTFLMVPYVYCNYVYSNVISIRKWMKLLLWRTKVFLVHMLYIVKGWQKQEDIWESPIYLSNNGWPTEMGLLFSIRFSEHSLMIFFAN